MSPQSPMQTVNIKQTKHDCMSLFLHRIDDYITNKYHTTKDLRHHHNKCTRRKRL